MRPPSTIETERSEPRTSYRGRAAGGPAPYELVMMTLVNMDSPGLVILPTHRVVHGLESFSAQQPSAKRERLLQRGGGGSSVDAVRARPSCVKQADWDSDAGGGGGTGVLLDWRSRFPPKLMPSLSLRQQSLDVVQLHKCLLEGVQGISEEAIRDQKNVRYIRDIDESMAQVRSGAANVAFLMNPARMSQVRDIAFAGEVLPQNVTLLSEVAYRAHDLRPGVGSGHFFSTDVANKYYSGSCRTHKRRCKQRLYSQGLK